jgi:anti-sigma B factor antagonist
MRERHYKPRGEETVDLVEKRQPCSKGMAVRVSQIRIVCRLVFSSEDSCRVVRSGGRLRMSTDQAFTEGTCRAVATVALVGEFDMARERALVEAVVALDLLPSTEVRLDMSAVTFVDSCGLRGLLAARAYLEGRGCELRLVRPSEQLVRIIEITSLGQILKTVDGDDL